MRPWPFAGGGTQVELCAQDQAIALLYDLCSRLKSEGAGLYAHVIERELIRPMESIAVLRAYAEAWEKARR